MGATRTAEVLSQPASGIYKQIMTDSLVTPNSLREVRLFDCLETNEGREAAAALVPTVYGEGETIFHEGDASDTCYILVAGEVEIVRDLPGGSRYSLASLRCGEVFGDMCLLTDLRRSATAVARQTSTVWLLYRHTFDDALAEGKLWAFKVGIQLARVMAGRLESLDGELVQMISRLPHHDAVGSPTGGLTGTPPSAAAGPRSDFERLRDRLIGLSAR